MSYFFEGNLAAHIYSLNLSHPLSLVGPSLVFYCYCIVILYVISTLYLLYFNILWISISYLCFAMRPIIIYPLQNHANRPGNISGRNEEDKNIALCLKTHNSFGRRRSIFSSIRMCKIRSTSWKSSQRHSWETAIDERRHSPCSTTYEQGVWQH